MLIYDIAQLVVFNCKLFDLIFTNLRFAWSDWGSLWARLHSCLRSEKLVQSWLNARQRPVIIKGGEFKSDFFTLEIDSGGIHIATNGLLLG